MGPARSGGRRDGICCGVACYLKKKDRAGLNQAFPAQAFPTQAVLPQAAPTPHAPRKRGHVQFRSGLMTAHYLHYYYIDINFLCTRNGQSQAPPPTETENETACAPGFPIRKHGIGRNPTQSQPADRPGSHGVIAKRSRSSLSYQTI